MAEIPHKDLKQTLEESKKGELPQVWLVHGEEFLYKKALETAVDFLAPESSRILNYDPMDGGSENVPKALERVNTYSLMPGVKVVALRDSRIFYSKDDKGGLLEKAKAAAEKNELKKASGYFVALLGALGLKFEDMDKEGGLKALGAEKKEDLAWAAKVLEYCRENDLSLAAEASDMPGMIIQAMERGFPPGHYLVITADTVSRTHRLYKAIKDNGLVVDCSVPKGERKADKVQQEAVLNERMREILVKSGKTMENQAYRAMIDMIGFDIRQFANDLEKLVNYVGEREKITVDDVKGVLKRTRMDPIYEFTNAVTDRNLKESLFLLESMLSSGTHPLQLLAAITNQIRRLVCAKGFANSPAGAVWQKNANYNYFQDKVMPALIEYDRSLSEKLEAWEERLAPKETEPEPEPQSRKAPGKKTPKKKSAPNTDLFIVKNPKSPFPVYQTLKKTDNFTSAKLKETVSVLAEADMLMKSTAQNPKRILEDVMFKICGM